MKILFAPLGTAGDVHPLVACAIHARERGHTVLMCVTAEWLELCRERGLACMSTGDGFEQATQRSLKLSGRPLRMLAHGIAELRALHRQQLSALEQPVREHELIIGSGLQASATALALENSLAALHILYSPHCIRSRHHSPPVFPIVSRNPVLNSLLWPLFDLVMFLAFAGPGGFGARRMKRLIDNAQDRLVIAQDRELFDVPPDRPDAKIIPYPYLDTGRAPCADLLSFLDSGAPPVFVGFGSMVSESHAGALARELRSMDVRVIVRGSDRSPKNRDPGLCILREPVAHHHVFPRCAAVIHHGGAGTTCTVARAGVPHVIVPHLLDQYYWAKRVCTIGIGVSSPLRGPGAIRRAAGAAARAASDRTMAGRARELYGSMAPGNDFRDFDSLIATTTGRSS